MAKVNPKTGKVNGASGRPKLTIEEIERELKSTGGMQVRTADRLGVSPSTICTRIANSKRLQETLKNIRDDMTEQCEDILMHKILHDKDTASVIFYLKCHGKARGWVQHTSVDATVTVNHDDWVKRAGDAIKEELKHGEE